MSEPIRFLLNGERVDVTGLAPETTLLEYLREERRLTGTKEGCAEGDCGACTVVLAERSAGAFAWKPINACIRLLPSVDGKAIYTVESLKARMRRAASGAAGAGRLPRVAVRLLHAGVRDEPVRALQERSGPPSRTAIDDALSGNLCRCTGYRPIVDAATRMYELPAASRLARRAASPTTAADRRSRRGAPRGATGDARNATAFDYEDRGHRWSAPRSLDAFADALAAQPDARIVAGVTDVGPVGHQAASRPGRRHPCRRRRRAARASTRPTRSSTIGAGVTLADAFAALDRRLARTCTRHGSASRRCRSATAARSAATSPTARRSAIRCRC